MPYFVALSTTAAENKTGRDEGNTVSALGCASVAMVMLTSDTQVTGPSCSGASGWWRPGKT